MRKLLFILLYVLPFTGFSQQNSEKESAVGKVHEDVKVQPEFPGGEEEFYTYLGKHIKYPKKDRRKGITGKVFLSFIVSEKGEITEAKIIRGLSKAIDEEALRVINSMPRWKPGTLNGVAARVQFNVPINFSLK